jgi:hypothetical protein
VISVGLARFFKWYDGCVTSHISLAPFFSSLKILGCQWQLALAISYN